MNDRPSLFFGLDPGSSRCGYAGLVVNGNSYLLLLSGTLQVKSSFELADKLAFLYDSLFAIITPFLATHEVHLALETQFLGKNPSSYATLSCVRGVLLLLGSKLKLSINEFSPAEIKQGVLSGSASKEQISLFLQKLFPSFSPRFFDESDALAIAFLAASQPRALRPAPVFLK